MAAKGNVSKEKITNKILQMFEGAFVSGKELRIPMMEDGTEVQIKVTLTAAKTNIEHDGAVISSDEINFGPVTRAHVEAALASPSEEEKENLRNLLASLDLEVVP